ncbi:MAG: 2-oxoacid:acceptor oxidoreductase family protein [Deltaproteobacteria bacterium]|nr:2-oxoacid:acceptor oxidoreductase family protein [Deltaproteobacteria bacterium]
MDDNRYEIRLSGSGGQGIILAALILAEASGVFDKKEVCQTQSYGPEARGGKSRADVVISDTPIDYPKTRALDFLLAMNQAACDAYFKDLKPSGLLLVDTHLVEQLPTDRAVAIPFQEIAIKRIGNEMTANMVAVGSLGVLSRAVRIRSLEKALLRRVPPKSVEMNLRALRAGAKAARKIDLDALPGTVTSEEDEV